MTITDLPGGSLFPKTPNLEIVYVKVSLGLFFEPCQNLVLNLVA